MGEQMRVIAKNTLRQFWNRHKDAQGTLEAWHDEALAAQWKTPHDIKRKYPAASICANNRVVFNICGNKYRLVIEIQYACAIAWIKFIGTHAEYDLIDVTTVGSH
jgi:mRNA interferase HigB